MNRFGVQDKNTKVTGKLEDEFMLLGIWDDVFHPKSQG